MVDRSRKFAFAVPLETKGEDGVARKLMELLLLFAIPRSPRSDPGIEFTAEVVSHLRHWLKIPLDYGPVDYPRAQGTVENLGGWIQGVLSKLWNHWPLRWDEYVQPVLWLHRTTSNPRLPGGPTHFRLLFGLVVRTQIEAISPQLHDSDLVGTGLHKFMADKREDWRSVLQTEAYQEALHVIRE